MARILYGISPIGLGHATRSLVVARALSSAGHDVKLFSGGKAAEFIRSQGLMAEDIVSDPSLEIVGGEMKRASLWYLRSWAALRGTKSQTEKLFDSYRPDLVVCDEEFSGITVAMEKGCKTAFISDELELGFARGWLARTIERRVEGWYRNLQASVDVLVIPESGEDSGNRRYVGPIVREVIATAIQTRASHALPTKGRMVLLSMSGSGLGEFLLRETVDVMKRGAVPGAFLAISGNRGKAAQGDHMFDLGIVSDNQNLVACADLVVSTAGKSTIDEAASAGTPIIVIPIKHHAEQERNAAALGYSPESLGNLAGLMNEKIGKREPPRKFLGVETISRLLISML
ncbi:MAG: hypothetical protein OK438_01550 [Thaumarchaeota archaeon]|nr:hypothetical protein [Nitrososphaerota archaeon]